MHGGRGVAVSSDRLEELDVTSPACGFYKCVVTWPKGLKVNINWLLPPAGDVSVSLVSNTGGAVYVITPSMSGTGTACDAGGGPGVAVSGATCGGLDFIVPNNWVEASNYTIQVQSLTTTTDVGYTDAITITAANSTTADSTVLERGRVRIIGIFSNLLLGHLVGLRVCCGNKELGLCVRGIVVGNGIACDSRRRWWNGSRGPPRRSGDGHCLDE
ncbi:hypothetical protein RQP46_007935 [Phenoliferia psychrophenolica]